MPAAEVEIDVDLVRSLLREQLQELASQRLIDAGEGWDNKLFRLGDNFVVRFPRRQAAAVLIEHEQRWLPVLAPQLPLPVPAPVRVGRPGCGFPWAWSVAPWFPGETADTLANEHTEAVAARLGEFLVALHQPAPADAPLNPLRTSLSSRSEMFVERLQRCGRQIDRVSAFATWRSALVAPEWPGPSLWLHGDLHPRNLVVNNGRLTAVIDFGDLTAGDPAVDLAVAWMLPEHARASFRRTVNRMTDWLDDGVWQRARGWALSFSVAYLANSLDNPRMGSIGHRTIAAVLADGDAYQIGSEAEP